MGRENNSLVNQILASVVAAASLSGPVMATHKVPPTPKAPPVPRGVDIEPIAGSCNIGPFPQTNKVGRYNSLCNTMSDAEKCLAFLKQHYDDQGNTTKTDDVDRLEYCLEELAEVLGTKP